MAIYNEEKDPKVEMVESMDKKPQIDITYLGSNLNIDISSNKDLDIELIYEALGDMDIVECNEINGNQHHGGLWIDSDRNVFFLSDSIIQKLRDYGKGCLIKQGNMADYVNTSQQAHLDFLLWYFGMDDIQDAVQMMYDQCGWVVTDIDTFQAYKDLMTNHIEGETFLFRENRYRPNIGDSEDNEREQWMCEQEIDYTKLTWQEIIDACEQFGYSATQVDKWITEGDETALICECYFEVEI